MEKITIFWFRRDLRLDDNRGLNEALKNKGNVLPVFIFDTDILEKLPDRDDARVTFIYRNLVKVKQELEMFGSSLLIMIGKPKEVFVKLSEDYPTTAVYTNHDYEPYAVKRDKEISAFLELKSIDFFTFKDQVIFEKDEVAKSDGKPYTIYTPYNHKWKKKLNSISLTEYPIMDFKDRFLKTKVFKMPSLSEIGFSGSTLKFPDRDFNEGLIRNYDKTRDFPYLEGTSRLGIHLRFGTVSIRKLLNTAKELNETFLNELIWREFFMMILWHFPETVHKAFKPKYDNIVWRRNEDDFKKWCNGETGYPIVDAGMRELNKTGFMHNRVRMITASFLVKHLLIDWRWGEACFARKLLDYEQSSNVGNWQWAAGSGCDAAPYFRIFNPYTQTEKFDPDKKYINKWVPEWNSKQYPAPVVEHKSARERALYEYKNALN